MSAYIVVTIGFLVTAVVLTLAVLRGRAKPARTVPWWIAIIALSLDVAFHVVVSIAALLAEGWEGSWIAIGTLAIAGVLATAIIQPRLAGWWFIASAALLPAVLAITDALLPADELSPIPVAVMLGFYSTRAAIVGGLLVWSAHTRPMEWS